MSVIDLYWQMDASVTDGRWRMDAGAGWMSGGGGGGWMVGGSGCMRVNV